MNTIAGLWRFPVKSMLGERVPQMTTYSDKEACSTVSEPLSPAVRPKTQSGRVSTCPG